jgi:hypothetical protein
MNTKEIGILGDMANNRVTNVRTLASRIASFGSGFSVREFLDALALAAGKLIKAAYRGPGLEIATRRFVETLVHAVQKD